MMGDTAILVAVWATGIGIGAVAQPMRGTRRVDRQWFAVAIITNVLLIPLATAIAVRLLGLSVEATIGAMLIAAAGGGALGLTTTRLAGGDVVRAVVLVGLLQALNVVTIPFWTTLTLEGGASAPLEQVGRVILLMLVLPLLIGVLLARARPDKAALVARWAGLVASISLVVAVAIVVWESAPAMTVAATPGLMLFAFTFIGGCLLVGAALGGPGGDTRSAMSQVTATRAIALALALSRSVYGDRPAASAVVILVGLVGIVLPIVAAVAIRPRTRSAADLIADREATPS